jgi:hypothetical protein
VVGTVAVVVVPAAGGSACEDESPQPDTAARAASATAIKGIVRMRRAYSGVVRKLDICASFAGLPSRSSSALTIPEHHPSISPNIPS